MLNSQCPPARVACIDVSGTSRCRSVVVRRGVEQGKDYWFFAPHFMEFEANTLKG